MNPKGKKIIRPKSSLGITRARGCGLHGRDLLSQHRFPKYSQITDFLVLDVF